MDKLPAKKEALLLVGKRLFLSKGFSATSVDEICAGAKVTKGTFYYFFTNKEAYAQTMLEYIWKPIRTMQETLLHDDIDPLDHLLQHVDYMVEFLPGDGRLIGIMAQELGETHPQIGGAVPGATSSSGSSTSPKLSRLPKAVTHQQETSRQKVSWRL